MRVERIVGRVLCACSGVVHAARLQAVEAVVLALCRARRIGLTALGRAVAGLAPRYGIKKVDRLVGSRLMRADVPKLSCAMAQVLLAHRVKRPVLLIDWTDVAGLWVLSAGLAWRGRALLLYQEAHAPWRLGNARVQRAFLHHLFEEVLPPGCRPIIVTDAGFHGAFFREVVALGGDFVGRIRGTAKVVRSWDGARFSKEDVYACATCSPRCLGLFRLYTKAAPVHAWLTLVREVPAPRRRRKGRGRRRPQGPGRNAAEARRRAHHPWLLATSLSEASARRVVALYAQRMQVEEAFRDLKNLRLGWGASALRTRSPARLTVLLALAALAMLAVCLTGAAAEAAGLARLYQANSCRTRRVLSRFRLGEACLLHGEPLALPLDALLRSVRAELNPLLTL